MDVKEKVLNLIRSYKGISREKAQQTFSDISETELNNTLDSLIDSGDISLYQGQYYNISRFIGVVPVGKEETEYNIEIGYLSVNEIRQWFTADEDDPLFFGGYLIDKAKADLFKARNIELDFEAGEHYLLAQFEN